MNYKFYYYEEEKLCFLSDYKIEKPELQNIFYDNSAIKISIADKNVENMYNFFKENTIKQILSSNPAEISIDYSEIEGLPFYEEDSFEKLKLLIDNTTIKCNSSIKTFIEANVEQNLNGNIEVLNEPNE